MVFMGFVQFGMAKAALGHEFDERFPNQSSKGLRDEWLRLEAKCYERFVADIGNTDLYDIYRSLQRQIRSCKQQLTNSSAMNILEVEACVRKLQPYQSTELMEVRSKMRNLSRSIYY